MNSPLSLGCCSFEKNPFHVLFFLPSKRVSRVRKSQANRMQIITTTTAEWMKCFCAIFPRGLVDDVCWFCYAIEINGERKYKALFTTRIKKPKRRRHCRWCRVFTAAPDTQLFLTWDRRSVSPTMASSCSRGLSVVFRDSTTLKKWRKEEADWRRDGERVRESRNFSNIYFTLAQCLTQIFCFRLWNESAAAQTRARKNER